MCNLRWNFLHPKLLIEWQSSFHNNTLPSWRFSIDISILNNKIYALQLEMFLNVNGSSKVALAKFRPSTSKSIYPLGTLSNFNGSYFSDSPGN